MMLDKFYSKFLSQDLRELRCQSMEDQLVGLLLCATKVELQRRVIKQQMKYLRRHEIWLKQKKKKTIYSKLQTKQKKRQEI